MKTKHLLILFIVTALLQAAIPVKMIYDSEMTEKHGTEFKFRTVPIDPADPFRGRYITLSYDISSFTTEDTTWTGGDKAYVTIGNDKNGFARIKGMSGNKPQHEDNYVLAEVVFNYGGRINLEFAFDRFYMEESKAPEAEKAYAEYSLNDKNKPAYAIVALRNGNAVVKDVIIDGLPVKEYVQRQRAGNGK